MDCCAQVQKCNMDNKFYNEQKDKYAKGKTNNTNQPNTSASDENLAQENIWLNQKLDQLQQQLKRKTQMINKMKKG